MNEAKIQETDAGHLRHNLWNAFRKQADLHIWITYLLAWMVLAGLLLFLRRDVLFHMLSQWDTDTYSHCILIAPMAMLMIYNDWPELKRLSPRPWFPALAFILPVLFLGFVGDIAGISLFQHYALVGGIVLITPLVMGLVVARATLFANVFLLFMVPVGDQLIPILQEITADFCIFMLDLAGVTFVRNGVMIYIAAGAFQVAQECSGVRFLIAMVSMGFLFSRFMYKSYKRRMLFLLLSAIVPIVANGFRAFGLIYYAHLMGDASVVAGADHIIYGWVFFMLVMVVTLGIGYLFKDRSFDSVLIDLSRYDLKKQPGSYGKLAAIVTMAVLFFGSIYSLSWKITSQEPDARMGIIHAPDIPGWTKTDILDDGWIPVFSKPDVLVFQTYERDGKKVTFAMVAYDWQRGSAKLVATQHPLVENGWEWNATLKGDITKSRTPEPYAHVIGGPGYRDVWEWFWVNGKVTGDPRRAKMHSILAKLGPADNQRAAAVIFSARRSRQDDSTEALLADFALSFGSLEERIPGILNSDQNEGAEQY